MNGGRVETKDVPLDRKKIAEVLLEVRAERECQHRKWGQQDHDLPNWFLTLNEVLGEAAKEANDFTISASDGEEETDAVMKGSLRLVRTRAVQLAAVAVAMVEGIDRKLNGKGIEKNEVQS